MNNKAVGFIAFAFGAGLTAVILQQYLKKKYEKIAQEEIDSVKETFSKRQKSEAEEKREAEEYATVLQKEGYTNYGDAPSDEEKEEETVDRPYVISPDEFGEFEEYERITLTYYADQLLVDEDDELVEDVDKTVGFESLKHFGEYEEDCVFVRNDGLCCDYEILLDERNYMDVIRQRPPKEGAN